MRASRRLPSLARGVVVLHDSFDELHLCALCDALIKEGADIHLADEKHWTPLHFAIAGMSQASRPALIACLLQYGADPLRPNVKGDTAFSFCDSMGERWGKNIKNAITDLLRAKVCELEAEALTAALEEGAPRNPVGAPMADVLKKRVRL